MSILMKNISSLVTVNANGASGKAGPEMQDIGLIKDGAILFNKTIEWVGTTEEAERLQKENFFRASWVINAKGRTVLPGFVDSHTHMVFGGSRSDEFGRRLRGATYQEIAEEGGGIQSTLRSTREASIDELAEKAINLAQSAIKYGTTSLEIKTGYGLSIESEIKMLKVIEILRLNLPIDVSCTFLPAHDFPPEYKNDRESYINLICDKMLPAAFETGIPEFCDAFVDKGYYTLDQAQKIFEKAQKLGFKIKMHADELADVGAAGLAARIGAVSADHLLFISPRNIDSIIRSGTIATLLPGTAYFIRMPYAPARALINSGATVALATDCNPGSCYTENMQTILSLAVINMKMTAEEAITAATLNGAAALNKAETYGSIEPGKNSNFIVMDCENYLDIFYHFGINHTSEVWVGGNRIY